MSDSMDRYRLGVLVALFVVGLAGLLFVEPIAQSVAYHDFRDSRGWRGIPNFADVVSNVPFALVGGLGLWVVFGPQGGRIFGAGAHRWPYAVFFAGVGLVSAGSAYYHLAPDNARLVWDRVPMTAAFMALFAAFIADRIDQRTGVRWGLPVLLAAGFASVWYWDWTEAQGRGDLRFYLFVQFFPVAVMPLLCWLFPTARYTTGRHLAWMIGWYAVAKAVEVYDAQIFAALGGLASGHTIKHVAAAFAALVVVRMITGSSSR